jgi:AbiV family abortive infection protein
LSASPEISEDVLLQGFWYALEQAGRLLHSARLLFENFDWSTAAGVALLGREELGRARILSTLANDVRSGKKLTAATVRVAYGDHVKKQEAGTSGVSIKGTPGTTVDRLIRKVLHNDPSSEDWRTARAQLDVPTTRKARRLPHDLHEQRMASFYVDLKQDALGWRRPSEIGREEALDVVVQANNDYSVELARLGDDVIETDFPQLAAARRAMSPKPELRPVTLPRNWTG